MPIGLPRLRKKRPEAHASDTKRGSAGYSLIELLIVLAIIGLIVGIAGPRVISYLETAKVKTAHFQIKSLGETLEAFYADVGRFPTTAEGLDALVHNPGSISAWTHGYLKGEKVPLDPWGNPYQYRSPGEHGAFDLYSFGRDGRAGGTGLDADITNWDDTATASTAQK